MYRTTYFASFLKKTSIARERYPIRKSRQRSQCVLLGKIKSEALLVKQGVPQGSVLGARLYTSITDQWECSHYIHMNIFLNL